MVSTRSEGKLLRIHIGADDRVGRKPLYQTIVERLRERGLAGATVLRGIEGFGPRSVLHKPQRFHLSVDHPLVIEVVDCAEKIDAVMPELDGLIGDGLITVEKVEVIAYRGGSTI
jgi:uncharacterized protein